MKPLKILFLVHGYPPTAVAGTELCAQRLCVALRDAGHDVRVVTREERPGSPEYKIIRDSRDGIPVTRIVNNFTRLRERYLYDFHPRIEEIFEEELDRYAPDLVHVQHLAGASWGIPGMVRRREIPLVVSLHDYWYACERVHLLRPDGSICPGPEGGRSCARYCAHGSLALMASAVMERARGLFGVSLNLPGERALLRTLALLQTCTMRRRTGRLVAAYAGRCGRLLGGLAQADVLISPSAKARAVYVSLGVPAEKILVIPHGAPPPAGPGGGGEPYDGSRPLIIGYTGTIMPHKGIVSLIRALRGFSPERVRLRLYGRAFPARFENYVKKLLRRFPRGQVELHGTYLPEELPPIMGSMDLLVIPSLWHETFNLVLWEAWAARLPVVAARVGALADFVRDGVDGLTYPPGDWRGLRKIIAHVVKNPAVLEALRRALPRSCMGVEENARKYEEVYAGLVDRREGKAAG